MCRFGDTINACSRIESSGVKGRIQVSEATANLLRDAGKSNWVTPREDKVIAKGIGLMQTYWVAVKSDSRSSSTTSELSSSHDYSHSSADHEDVCCSDKQVGLVGWHTECLAQFLKVVVAQQRANKKRRDDDSILDKAEHQILENKKAPIEELTDKLDFPEVTNLDKIEEAANSIDLDMKIMMQLRNFVFCIASM